MGFVTTSCSSNFLPSYQTTTGSSSTWTAELTCPGGKKILGGGCYCYNFGNPGFISEIHPTQSNTRTKCQCESTGQDATASIICANQQDVPGYETISNSGSGSSQSNCPTGKKVVGGGCKCWNSGLSSSGDIIKNAAVNQGAGWECGCGYPSGSTATSWAICADSTFTFPLSIR